MTGPESIDGATSAMEVPNKRPKFSPDSRSKFVDLTLDDESDDDDIIIVGSREVQKTPGFNRQAPKNLTIPTFHNMSTQGSSNLLAPPNKPALPLNFERFPQSASQSQSSSPASSSRQLMNQNVKTEPTSNFEAELPVLSNNPAHFVKGMPPVIFNSLRFNNENDVNKFDIQLGEKYNKAKEELLKCTGKSADLVSSVQLLNHRKERLRKLGTKANDITMVEIIQKLSKLSESSRALHVLINDLRSKSQNFKIEYLHFHNRVKMKIIKMLSERPKPTPHLTDPRLHPDFAYLFRPVTVEGVPELLRAIKQKLASPIPTNFRPTLVLLYQQVVNQLATIERNRGRLNHMNAFDNALERLNNDGFNGIEANIYNNNSEDSAHLKELLESVKKVEEEKQGESQTPENLTVNLLTHQRLGLHWLELAEDDKNKRGGILADDMGLGKTVQLISLILSHKPDDDAEYKTTLVVCPVALMNQWQAEIEMKVKEAAGLSVFIFHSVKQKYSFEQLKKYDVVITSFTTLATEYKKHIADVVEHEDRKAYHNINEINRKKISIPNSYGSPFFTSDAKFHRTILDEVQWIKNKATNASLSVTCINSHFRWCLSGTPLQNKIDELFPYLRFLRIKPYDKEEKFRFDIVLPLKSNDYDDYDKSKAMHKVRVLLKAILLRREKNSIIDGKPILQLPGKEVRIEVLDISTNKNEASFYYSMEQASAEKVRKILDGPKAKGNYSNILALLLRLRQAAIHSELVRIGERKKGIIYDEDGKISHDPRKVISRMCVSASQFKSNVINRINEIEKEEDGNRFKCPICFDSPPDEDWTFFAPCGHGVCNECVDGFFEQRAEVDMDIRNEKLIAKCSECRLVVRKDNLVSYDIFDRICNRKQTKEMVEMIKEKELKEALSKKEPEIKGSTPLSPKLERAIKLIKDILSKNPNDKIIIFSQFTTLFDLFAPVLVENDIPPLLYVGSMNATSRTEVIKQFYRDDEYKVLLISMKAGNVGLTLTCANHVIIMDPFWNPYVEEQAQDRAYRIGQFKPVTIYRILVGDSVEDRIMELQKKKKELIESAMDEKGRNYVSGLNRQEIGLLFGIRDL